MVVKLHITIIFCVITVFRSNISCFNIWKQIVILISNWDQKTMETIVFIFYDKLSKNDCMISINTQISNPPFGRVCCGTMDDELFIFFIISSSCSEILDV